MVIMLAVVISLVTWALHLMQQAFENREFSFMLAGLLVCASAAGVIVVYMLLENYIIFLANVQ